MPGLVRATIFILFLKRVLANAGRAKRVTDARGRVFFLEMMVVTA
jgi:hypothetical protein